MEFKDQVYYWAHMLDESYGDKDELPQYIGKLDGYKWLYCVESNITENQWIKSFDSEEEAMSLARNDIERIFKDGWTDNLQDPNSGETFKTQSEAYAFFQKNKVIELTDGSSFKEILSCIKIRASEMPSLLKIVYDKSDEYEFSPKFDGNNLDADGLYAFDAWNKINDMRA